VKVRVRVRVRLRVRVRFTWLFGHRVVVSTCVQLVIHALRQDLKVRVKRSGLGLGFGLV
jgi:hypothetical protein